MITQFCKGGDFHRFAQQKGRLIEIISKKFAMQLKYLHLMDIILRDLKPQNIFYVVLLIILIHVMVWRIQCVVYHYIWHPKY